MYIYTTFTHYPNFWSGQCYFSALPALTEVEVEVEVEVQTLTQPPNSTSWLAQTETQTC